MSPTYSADDVGAINARMNELRAAKEIRAPCVLCGDTGWVQPPAHHVSTTPLVCPGCGNPNGKARP